MLKKVISWLIFSVSLALLPFLLKYLSHLIFKIPFKFEYLFLHGELFIVATALAAAAIGEIIVSDKQHGILMLCSGGGCVLTVVTASMLFALVSGTEFFDISIDISAVRTVSIIVYLLAFLTSGSSIIIVAE